MILIIKYSIQYNKYLIIILIKQIKNEKYNY